MRAHFASDVPASPDIEDGGLHHQEQDSDDGQKAQSATAESQEQLKSRIMEFKSDTTKMAVVGEFIDDVLEKAEVEANKQQDNDNQNTNSQQNKNKTPKQNFKNGKVVNKARGFVVRLFESICNCANNAAAAPVGRFKFRSGKRTSSSTTDEAAAAAAETNGKSDNMKKEEKSNKTGNGKQKKSAGIKFKDEKDEVEQETIELQ